MSSATTNRADARQLAGKQTARTRRGGRAADSPALGTLSELVAPLGLEEFFRDYYDRRPVHLPGGPARGRTLLSHESLCEMLWRRGRSRGQVFTFPLPGPAAAGNPLADYFTAGYPVIWNGARGASARIDHVCAELGEALGAHVWPNVYSTGTAGAPLDVHFDLHEVFVVQCEGEKEWHISGLRADRPLDVPEMRGAVGEAVEAAREQARANTLMKFTARPGDVVYIPRGQFHAASTPRGRSLHVTFAVRQLCGYDLARALCCLALADPEMRTYLPGEASGGAGAGVEALKRRLRQLLDGPRFDAALAEIRADLIARSHGEDTDGPGAKGSHARPTH